MCRAKTKENRAAFTSMAQNCPPHSRSSGNSEAFSTLEVLVTLAIFGVVLLSLYSGITSGFAFVRLTRENLRATQIMAEKMETLRLYRWDQVNQAGFVPTNFVDSFAPFRTGPSTGPTYTGTVAITASPISEFYGDDLRQVMITVSWLSGNAPRTRRMTSLVGHYGLQNYIY